MLAAQKLDLQNKLDNDMFNHISYVTNRCLIELKKDGVSEETFVTCGKFLWRLFRVTQAYNAKKRDVTLDEVISIIADFKSVFTG